MPGFFSGNFAWLKLLHPLEDDDNDIVGPGAWTVISTATFTTTGARFGKAILCDASGEALRSDADVAGFDDSDGAKTLFHCFWQTDSLSFVRNQILITAPSFAPERSRLAFDTFGTRIIARWVRSSDLGPGLNTVEVRSNGGKVSVDTPFTLVGFVDGGSISEGKVFINGIDETAAVVNISRPGLGAGGTKRIVLGNDQIGISPARIVDEVSIVQDPGLTDSLVATLEPQYRETRGFGFRPIFSSLEAA